MDWRGVSSGLRTRAAFDAADARRSGKDRSVCDALPIDRRMDRIDDASCVRPDVQMLGTRVGWHKSPRDGVDA